MWAWNRLVFTRQVLEKSNYFTSNKVKLLIFFGAEDTQSTDEDAIEQSNRSTASSFVEKLEPGFIDKLLLEALCKSKIE